jgi:hypothetical protein
MNRIVLHYSNNQQRTVHDGHDSSVSVSGAWAKAFLQPLLSNSNFLNNTLVLLSASSIPLPPPNLAGFFLLFFLFS